ncbi:MAG: LysM peptidoglycan-binding domain-containing protein [Mycoplasmatota bacterium]
MEYIVKEGDSIFGIAKQYNSTVESIKELNNLDNIELKKDQVLQIEEYIKPALETYIVKENENLYEIANKFDVNIDNLKEINKLDNNIISTNQKLFIPLKIIKECFGPDELNYIMHTVKQGDNLYDLAIIYGTNVDNIKKLNNLSNNNLQINQLLKIKEI